MSISFHVLVNAETGTGMDDMILILHENLSHYHAHPLLEAKDILGHLGGPLVQGRMIEVLQGLVPTGVVSSNVSHLMGTLLTLCVP